MTFDQYIQNPMGKKNAVFSKRELFRNMYADKLDKILLRENGKIEYVQMVNSKADKYYVYIKIPSEVIKKFYYDVVIEFSSDNPLTKGQQTLTGYDVKFYSNDPAFVFTFCHAFVENKMFMTELSPKMSKLALKNVAKERNPKDEVGYVKSIFFAYLYMKSRGLFNKITYTGAATFDLKAVLKKITHADEKIRLRQQAQEEFNKKLKDDDTKVQNKAKSRGEEAAQITKNFEVDAVKTVLTSKFVGRSKGGKKTKMAKTVHKK